MTRRFRVLVVTAVFYLLMFLLTVFSKMNYRNSLTEVTVKSLEIGYVKVDGASTSVAMAPDGLDAEKVFTIERTEINGTVRMLARRLTDVKSGCTEEGKKYLSGAGIGFGTVVVLEGSEELCEGKEVKVLNEEELPSWWE